MKKRMIILLVVLLLFTTASGCTPVVQGATTAPTSQVSTTQPAAPATSAPAAATTAPATATPTPVATATPEPTDAAPKDYAQIGSDLMATESIGTLRLGMTESQLVAALGKPASKSKSEVWGADGMEHTDWSYKTKGYVIDLSREAGSKAELSIYSISASSPCDQATQRGIKIGDTKEAVLKAYSDAIDSQGDAVTDDSIVAGTVFGGVLFSIKDGLVSGIFIGAGAE